MPVASQYLFTHKELVEVLIKKAGVHEGRWLLMAGFGLSAGNFGPSPEQMSPGAIVAVTNIGIQRAEPNTPEPMSVDAAVVNPAPST